MCLFIQVLSSVQCISLTLGFLCRVSIVLSFFLVLWFSSSTPSLTSSEPLSGFRAAVHRSVSRHSTSEHGSFHRQHTSGSWSSSQVIIVHLRFGMVFTGMNIPLVLWMCVCKFVASVEHTLLNTPLQLVFASSKGSSCINQISPKAYIHTAVKQG